MKNPKNVVNLVIASLLLVVVTSLGIYVSSSVQADDIYPGYASAKINLIVNSVSEQDIPIVVKFQSQDSADDNYDHKERSFHLEKGQNNIAWTIKRLESGNRKMIISTNTGIFNKSTLDVNLKADQINEIDGLTLTLPELITPVRSLPTPEQEEPDTQGYSQNKTVN